MVNIDKVLTQLRTAYEAYSHNQNNVVKAAEALEAIEVIESLMDAYKAAILFIKCHVADPDITHEMRLAYAHWQELDAALQSNEAKS